MKKMKRLLALLCSLSLLTFIPVPARADAQKVVTLGADLTDAQKMTMLNYFHVDPSEVRILYITNQDEREHLGGYVPLEQIGTRTLSCAYVKPTNSGGIKVRTANLTWVTGNMIASTLSTSGVKNCEVIAACPFEVSGTGALTGIQMAYELAMGEKLDPVKKEIATQEIVVTGNLAEQVGQNDATAVVNQSKMEVIGNNVTNSSDIYNIVSNVAEENRVYIDQEQLDRIVQLMEEIARQDYQYEDVKETLEHVNDNTTAIAIENGTIDATEVTAGPGYSYASPEDNAISGIEPEKDVEEPAPLPSSWQGPMLPDSAPLAPSAEDTFMAQIEAAEEEDSIFSHLDDTILGDNVVASSTEDISMENAAPQQEEEEWSFTWTPEDLNGIYSWEIPDEPAATPTPTPTPVPNTWAAENGLYSWETPDDPDPDENPNTWAAENGLYSWETPDDPDPDENPNTWAAENGLYSWETPDDPDPEEQPSGNEALFPWETESQPDTAENGQNAGTDTNVYVWEVPEENSGAVPAVTMTEDEEKELESRLSQQAAYQYAKVVSFCKGEYEGDAEEMIKAVGQTRVPSYMIADSVMAEKLSKAVRREYLTILSEGTSSYVPDDDEKYFNDELNMMDQFLQKLFGINGKAFPAGTEDILKDLTASNKEALYKDTIRFFENFYGESYDEDGTFWESESTGNTGSDYYEAPGTWGENGYEGDPYAAEGASVPETWASGAEETVTWPGAETVTFPEAAETGAWAEEPHEVEWTFTTEGSAN